MQLGSPLSSPLSSPPEQPCGAAMRRVPKKGTDHVLQAAAVDPESLPRLAHVSEPHQSTPVIVPLTCHRYAGGNFPETCVFLSFWSSLPYPPNVKIRTRQTSYTSIQISSDVLKIQLCHGEEQMLASPATQSQQPTDLHKYSATMRGSVDVVFKTQELPIS